MVIGGTFGDVASGGCGVPVSIVGFDVMTISSVVVVFASVVVGLVVVIGLSEECCSEVVAGGRSRKVVFGGRVGVSRLGQKKNTAQIKAMKVQKAKIETGKKKRHGCVFALCS